MSTLTGLLFTPTPDPEDDVKARSGLFVKLVNQDTSETVTSTTASVDGTFSVIRPSPGTYYVSTSPDGTTWTAIGTQEVAPANADILHTAGDETATGIKNLQTVYALDEYVAGGLLVDPRHPNYGAKFDGTTDDTSAIQAALNAAYAAGGGVVELPSGTTKITSSLTKPPSVSIKGRHPYSTIIDYRGAGPAILGTSVWLHDSIEDLAITHANNTNPGVTFMDAQLGATSCRFRNLRGIANPAVTNNGFIVRGVNPATGTANNNQYNNIFDNVRTSSTGALASGYGLYLFGQDINNARANGNLVQGGVYDGFVNCLFMNGNGNALVKPGFNSASGSAITIQGDSGCFENNLVGCYLDSSITGAKITLNSTSSTYHYMASMLGCLGIYDTSHITLAGSNTTAIGFGFFGRKAAFSGGTPTTLTGVDQQSVGPQVDTGIMSYKGGTSDLSGRILASGASFVTAVNSVGPAGSLSACVQDTANAQFRVVKTTNGSSFTILLTVNNGGDIIAARCVRTASGTTGSRPSASTVGAGAQWYDTTLGQLIASNGSAWQTASGVIYTPSLTPTAVAANTTAEQTFTVTGLAVGQSVVVNGPAPTVGTGIVGARVSAANTLALTFLNATSGSLTPAAGTYTVRAT